MTFSTPGDKPSFTTAVASRILLGILWAFLVLVGASCAPGTRLPPMGWAGPAIAGEQIFVSKVGGTLHALRLDDRSEMWQFPPQGSDEKLAGIYGMPLVDGETLFVGGEVLKDRNALAGKLYALRASTGERIWSFPSGASTIGAIVGGPIKYQGTIIVGAEDGVLYAVDSTTGQKVWSTDTREYDGRSMIWASPVLAGDTLYVGTLSGRLLALDPANGRRRWDFKAGGSIAGPVLVAQGRVYVGSFDKTLYALDATSGAKVAELKGKGWWWGQPVLRGDTLYVGSLDDSLYALDPVTLGKKWSFQTGGPIRSEPLVLDDMVVVASQDGKVYTVKASSGEMLWTHVVGFPVLGSMSASEGAVVYASASNGMTIALDVKQRIRQWQWPPPSKG